MSHEIRRITPGELLPWIDGVATTFLEHPDLEKIAARLRQHADLSRLWGAFDGRVVGTLRSWATELTVPGGQRVPASAIVAVTVLPTHRRRGILRAMMAAERAAALERGEPLAILHASEASIYGRFGFGPATMNCTWTVDTHSAGFVGPAATGVELAPVDAATAAMMRGIHDQFRLTRVGEIARDEASFRLDLGLIESGWGPAWKGWVIIHRDADGAMDGYARYQAESRWESRQPRLIADVQDLIALNDAAYRDLWRFLADLDLVATVRAERRSPHEPLPWLLANRRAASQTDLGDAIWVALLDLPAALAARTYERAGDLVIEVVDPMGAGHTRIRLEAGPGGVACSPTDRSPDLTLHAGALGAAYLGGSPLAGAAIVHGFEEHRPGALDAADAMFRTSSAPHCSTFF
jgi:predicted acetyltransferase